MPESKSDGGSDRSDRFENPETAMGGADSVQKTTYVTGEGTEPEGRQPEDRRKGRDAHSGSRGMLWTAIGLLILVALVLYVTGVAR